MPRQRISCAPSLGFPSALVRGTDEFKQPPSCCLLQAGGTIIHGSNWVRAPGELRATTSSRHRRKQPLAAALVAAATAIALAAAIAFILAAVLAPASRQRLAVRVVARSSCVLGAVLAQGDVCPLAPRAPARTRVCTHVQPFSHNLARLAASGFAQVVAKRKARCASACGECFSSCMASITRVMTCCHLYVIQLPETTL